MAYLLRAQVLHLSQLLRRIVSGSNSYATSSSGIALLGAPWKMDEPGIGLRLSSKGDPTSIERLSLLRMEIPPGVTTQVVLLAERAWEQARVESFSGVKSRF